MDGRAVRHRHPGAARPGLPRARVRRVRRGGRRGHRPGAALAPGSDGAQCANSPFWQGKDTGYSSYRSRVWLRWPSAGRPRSSAPSGTTG
ncbi:glutamate-cysteine ligase family protein [Streptomyces coeruleorubidus]|uniref:glutamate-cysteine ligase family protein n=1 Tax=Streptomyces coeruleorubidus TaxID=116188 RepID=UPI003CD04679